MVQETFNRFVMSARGLGDYQSMSKTELANGYCDADESNDLVKKDQYFSALVLRYWFKAKEFAQASEFARLELDDFVSWVAESLMIGFKYRRWRDPLHPLSKDPNGPDKVFNRALFSTRKRWLTYLNKGKRRLNFTVESIEEQIEIYGKNAQCLTDHYTEPEVQTISQAIVQSYVNRGNIVSAIIIDSIAHQDMCVVYPEHKRSSPYVFSQRALSKHLKELSKSYINYFKSTYEVENEKILEISSYLSRSDGRKLREHINKTILKLKNNPKMIDMLKERL
jgi:hypothetical protein